MNIYYYFFYVRYKRWLKSHSWHDTAHLSAVLEITLMTWFNLISVAFIFSAYVFNSVPKIDTEDGKNIVVIATSLSLLFLLHYFLLCYKKKYSKVVGTIDEMPQNELTRTRILFGTYIILSIIVPITAGILYSKL